VSRPSDDGLGGIATHLRQSRFKYSADIKGNVREFSDGAWQRRLLHCKWRRVRIVIDVYRALRNSHTNRAAQFAIEKLWNRSDRPIIEKSPNLCANSMVWIPSS
jgi:hypothetical protein